MSYYFLIYHIYDTVALQQYSEYTSIQHSSEKHRAQLQQEYFQLNVGSKLQDHGFIY